MASTVLVCKTQEEVFKAAADFFCEKVPVSPKAGPSFSIALSGGSTPRGLFRLLTEDPYRSQCHWPVCTIFWGDERCVPPDHSDSNFRMAKENLLDHVPIDPRHVFRMEGEREPEDAALRYEQVLSEQLHIGKNDLPQFDLILLGMGPDAHTASLFPGTTALQETKRTVVANWVEKLQTFRITLTPPVLNAAKNVVFLVCGQDKAQAVQSVLEGPRAPERYPSQLVNPLSGGLTWIMDQSAASLLTDTMVTNRVSYKER